MVHSAVKIRMDTARSYRMFLKVCDEVTALLIASSHDDDSYTFMLLPASYHLAGANSELFPITGKSCCHVSVRRKCRVLIRCCTQIMIYRCSNVRKELLLFPTRETASSSRFMSIHLTLTIADCTCNTPAQNEDKCSSCVSFFKSKRIFNRLVQYHPDYYI